MTFHSPLQIAAHHSRRMKYFNLCSDERIASEFQWVGAELPPSFVISTHTIQRKILDFGMQLDASCVCRWQYVSCSNTHDMYILHELDNMVPSLTPNKILGWCLNDICGKSIHLNAGCFINCAYSNSTILKYKGRLWQRVYNAFGENEMYWLFQWLQHLEERPDFVWRDTEMHKIQVWLVLSHFGHVTDDYTIYWQRKDLMIWWFFMAIASYSQCTSRLGEKQQIRW